MKAVSAAGTVLVTSLVFCAPVQAQSSTPSGSPTAGTRSDAAPQAVLHAVSGESVLVRSGAGDSYYPIGKLKTGDVVPVIGEKFGWARVHTSGASFRDMFAFIRYPKSDTPRVQLLEGGKRGRAVNRVDVLAPNMNTAFAPADAWRRMIQLDVGAEFPILETLESERDVVYRIPLPEKAECWIIRTALAPATPEQIAIWKNAPSTPTAAAPLAKPETELTALAPAPEAGTPGTPGASGGPATAQGTETDASGAAAVGAADTDATAPAEIDATPRGRLDALEKAYAKLQNEPIESAEVIPLRELYLALAAEAEVKVPGVARFASSRAEQLAIWSELQARRLKIAELSGRMKEGVGDAAAARLAADHTGPYNAVGRLSASTIFEGSRLPKLMRLQDPATGRTIAYLKPDDEAFDLHSLLGQLIGIIGTTGYDAGLRLNVITPRRVDLLSPKGETPRPTTTAPAAGA